MTQNFFLKPIGYGLTEHFLDIILQYLIIKFKILQLISSMIFHKVFLNNDFS